MQLLEKLELVFLCMVYLVIESSVSVTITKWLSDLKPHYNRYAHPGYDENNQSKSIPTDIEVKIYIESIGNFQPATMDYELDIYMIEMWKDHRLAHNTTEALAFNHARRIWKTFWLPDLYFTNSRFAHYTLVTVPNLRFLVHPDGSVRYSVRISLKASCHMDFKMFPADTQECFLIIQPYMSDETKVVVTWASDGNITQNPNIIEAELKMIETSANYCNGSYEDGYYSCLRATFKLQREIGASLISTFGPTSFIVMISWISFWIDPASAPARVGLSITTLLTFSTQSSGIRSRLPPVSYTSALDYWLFVCQCFLFATLFQYAVVNMYLRNAEFYLKKRKDLKLQLDTKALEDTLDEEKKVQRKVVEIWKRRDRVVRFDVSKQSGTMEELLPEDPPMTQNGNQDNPLSPAQSSEETPLNDINLSPVTIHRAPKLRRAITIQYSAPSTPTSPRSHSACSVSPTTPNAPTLRRSTAWKGSDSELDTPILSPNAPGSPDGPSAPRLRRVRTWTTSTESETLSASSTPKTPKLRRAPPRAVLNSNDVMFMQEFKKSESLHWSNMKRANWLDKISRIVFPLGFFAFVVTYWGLLNFNTNLLL